SILQSYDGNGNLASLTPPGKPVHTFGYSGVDLRTSYVPPDLGTGGGGGAPQTTWDYDGDRQLQEVTRPDGQTVQYIYNATNGRLDSILNPSGNRTFTYDATHGQLASISTPTVSLELDYDGHLLTEELWKISSVTLGSVQHGYDDFFEVVTEQV